MEKVKRGMSKEDKELIHRLYWQSYCLLLSRKEIERMAEEDIAILRDRYGVPSKKDLEKRIKRKEIYSHPAWEDLITWENLEKHMTWLKETLRQVG